MSTFPSLANAVLDYAPLRAVAGLFGIAGINFLVVLIGTSIALLAWNEFSQFLPERQSLFGRKRSRTVTSIIFLSYLFIITITGFTIYSNRFYQKNVTKLLVPNIPVSCILSHESLTFNDTMKSVIWDSTQQRLQLGDRIVLWSEEAIEIKGNDEEQMVINKAISMVRDSQSSASAYLGVTYLKKDSPLSSNHFVLVDAQGVLWNYRKAHPVPGVEDNIRPGPAELPTAHTALGLLGGGICFDLDFPDFIRQAGNRGVRYLSRAGLGMPSAQGTSMETHYGRWRTVSHCSAVPLMERAAWCLLEAEYCTECSPATTPASPCPS